MFLYVCVFLGLAQYSGDPRIEWHLNAYSTKDAVIDAVRNLPYKGGNTLTGEERDSLTRFTPLLLSLCSSRILLFLFFLFFLRCFSLLNIFVLLCQHLPPFLLHALFSPPYFSLGLALNFILENCFKPESGSREGLPKIGILITDGKSQDDVIPPAERLRNAGIELFAIGKNKNTCKAMNTLLFDKVVIVEHQIIVCLLFPQQV